MKQKNLLLLLFLFIIHNLSFSQENLTTQQKENVTEKEVLRLVLDEKYNEVIQKLDIMEKQDSDPSYFYTASKIHFAFISSDFNWILSNLDKIRFFPSTQNPPKKFMRHASNCFENTFHKNTQGYRNNNFANSLWVLSKEKVIDVIIKIQESHYDNETKDFLMLLEFYYYNNLNIHSSYDEYKSIANDFEKEYPNSKYNSFIKEKCFFTYNKKSNLGIAYSCRALISIDKRKDLDAIKANTDPEIGLEVEWKRNIFGLHFNCPYYYLNNNLSIENKHYKRGDTISNFQVNLSYQRAIPIYRNLFLQPIAATGISYNIIRSDNGINEIKTRLGNGWNAEAGAAIVWRINLHKYTSYRKKVMNYIDLGVSYSYKYIDINKSHRFSLNEGYHMIGILLKFGWIRYLTDKQ
ncbi:MAG: hypothetical protein ACEPOV_03080 [Hyphomicrobiales bacterium]